MISRTTIKNDCIAAFKEQKLALKEMFKGATCRFSLTADMWTSNQTMGYMCVTCHFIDIDWKVHKRIIKFFGVKTPHTGVQMFNTMLSCIQDWNIADKIFSVTLDNASANDSMAKLLKCNLKVKKTVPARGKLLHNRCAAHFINLIAKDGLKVIDSVVCNIRESVKYIDGSQSRKEKFEEIISQEGITCELHPTVDVCTRWNSTYLMLNAAFPFMRAYDSLAVQDTNYKYAPSSDQWERATIVCRILKVLYDATMVVSGSLYPTSNLYFHEMWKIKLVLDKERSNSDTEVASMAKKMKDKFDKYWIKSYKYLCIPVIFDPRFKFKFVEFRLGQAFGENAQDRIDKVKKRLNMLFKEYSNKLKDSSANSVHQADHVMAVSENDPIADWVQHMTEQLSEQVDTELDMYLKENPIQEFGNKFNILNWWKANCSKYPTLACIARDVLAWPASTVASESAFSTGSRVISDFRCSLTMDSVEALICLQDWFRASTGPNINVSSVNGISYSDNFMNLDLEDSMDCGSL